MMVFIHVIEHTYALNIKTRLCEKFHNDLECKKVLAFFISSRHWEDEGLPREDKYPYILLYHGL